MDISEIEVYSMASQAIQRVAEKLRIKDRVWLPPDELLVLIDEADAKARALLGMHLSAYRNWYGFHKRMSKLAKQGILDADESQELARLTGLREQTRVELANYVETLP